MSKILWIVASAAMASLTCLTVAGEAADLHVSPTGSDRAAGTAGDPLATLTAALRGARPGDRVLLHTGTYLGDDRVETYGTPAEPITVVSADGPHTATILGVIPGAILGERDSLHGGGSGASVIFDGVDTLPADHQGAPDAPGTPPADASLPSGDDTPAADASAPIGSPTPPPPPAQGERTPQADPHLAVSPPMDALHPLVVPAGATESPASAEELVAPAGGVQCTTAPWQRTRTAPLSVAALAMVAVLARRRK